jgi:hypothetical protein
MLFNLSANSPFSDGHAAAKLIGHPPQQQSFGVAGLVELELVALLPAIDLEGPTCVLKVLAAARGLHDTVE